MLTADDEVRLGEAVRAGAEQCRAATEELVRHNQALVLRVAVTADTALPLEDRVQAGNLGLLQARSYRVLGLRYGLPDGDPMTLEEIGHEVGVTRERIRQIEKRALETLREQLTPAA